MQYFKPFTFFARKPKTGWTNVLLGTVCTFIPVVGAMVLFGYRAEVSDDLEHDPALERYSDFSFDHFMRYLMRGVWPFLTNLIVGFGIGLPGYALGWITGILVFQATGEMIVAVAAGAVVFVVLIFAMSALLWPMELHAMKTRKLNLVAEFKFAIGFLRVVGLETIVSIFLFNMLGQVLMLLGLLACFVGIYPAVTIYSMAEQHLILQLYQRYIEEGGKPIDTWSEFDEEDDDVPRRKARRIDPEND